MQQDLPFHPRPGFPDRARKVVSLTGKFVGMVFAILAGRVRSQRVPGGSRPPVAKEQKLHQDQVLAYVKARGSITNAACRREFGLGKGQAWRLLEGLVSQGMLRRDGEGRGAMYKPVKSASF